MRLVRCRSVRLFDHADLSDEKNLFTLRLVKLV